MTLKKNYFLIILALVATTGFVSCKGNSGVVKVYSISMEDFISKYDQNNKVQVLDVRTPDEYAEGHIPGAKLVPLNEVTSGANIPYDKNSLIYAVCRSGHRSMQATQYLRDHGYTDIWSVDGGTMSWIGHNKPTDK